jgi:hypothetical protein
MKHNVVQISYLFWELDLPPEAQQDAVFSCTLHIPDSCCNMIKNDIELASRLCYIAQG